jgi:acyl-CoA thioesterase FadM
MNWLRGRVVPNGDVGFVVRELNIKYLQPLRVADEFVVETQMVDVGAAIVRVEQKFVKDGAEYAIINIKVAYLGGDMRPKRIPDEFINGLV